VPEKKKLSAKTDKSILQQILKISEEIHNINDIDILLDKILFEVRRFTNAEAGTIFLVNEGKLRINYSQNDILFEKDPSSKYKYLYHDVPIDSSSISGAVAMSGKIMSIKDVYKMPQDCNCGFNRDFDIRNNYRTQSVLAVPLKTVRNKVIGVMQIINAKNDRGKIVPFSDKDEIFVTYFGNDAAIAIEKAKSTREMVLRMLRMVEFRDPGETGGHVKRMGAYAVEIYQQWATTRGFPMELIRRFKDKYRIAAMLHDAGKIGISDKILKKPGKLDDDEFNVMKMHTVLGYRLFTSADSEIDAIAAEVALTHHEKWDGTGYPGMNTDVTNAEIVTPGFGKKGVEIPITGRIVAVADVYDALMSPRVYKAAWDEGRVLEHIKEASGKHFDPEVVESFFKIYDVISAIRQKYSEEGVPDPA
jgi:HD-GYP domain-containing protein (c-di-GMP phosphodiesterase class II)